MPDKIIDTFDANRTTFTRRMADGHRTRTGHALAGHYVPTADAGIVKLVRTCCEAPGHVTTPKRAGVK